MSMFFTIIARSLTDPMAVGISSDKRFNNDREQELRTLT